MLVGYNEHVHCRGYRILPNSASQYVVAWIAIFDERPVIRRMLSRCGSSEELSSDEEKYTYSASGGDLPSAPNSIAA